MGQKMVQNHPAQEIDRFFPEKSDLANESITSFRETLNKMTYLDAVIKEGMRIYGPAHLLSRGLDGEIDLGDDFKIKIDKESTGRLQTLLLTYSSMKYDISKARSSSKDQAFLQDDYKKFNPERFLTNQYEFKSYNPFSKGVRDCIGQPLAMLSMKIQLIHIYKNFKTEVVYKTKDDLSVFRPMVANFVFQMENEPCIRFLRR